jgi:guanylate kinase
LFLLSAPSGSGKTTMLEALLRRDRKRVRSISSTTRPPRPGERHGKDYFFLSRAQFRRGIARGKFLEHARVLQNWYGTPRGPIEKALKSGKDVLLGIDIQGARQVRRSGLAVTTIFLLPPSLKALRQRLRGRATETPTQIRERLCLARKELKEVGRYDYAVVNNRLQDAVAAVETILRAEHHRTAKK